MTERAQSATSRDERLANARRRLHEFLAELVAAGNRYHNIKPDKYETGRAIVNASPEEQAACLVASIVCRNAIEKECGWNVDSALAAVQKRLLRRKLRYVESDIADLAAVFAERGRKYWDSIAKGTLGIIRRYAEENELPAVAVTNLQRCRDLTARYHEYPDAQKIVAQLNALVDGGNQVGLVKGEAWSDAAIADLDEMDAARKTAWIKLLSHCESAAGGQPAAKWAKVAQPLLDAVGLDEFKTRILKWAPLVDKPRTIQIEQWSECAPNPNLMIIDLHADILKGLAWCCGLKEDRELARSLTALAVSAYKKVPRIGPRAVKLGNACVVALGAMPGTESVGQLALLKVRVKFRTAQKLIEKALDETAERVGIPRDELEEMAVPAYGLTEVGLMEESLGDFTARLRVTGTNATELVWVKPDGKTQKSVPAAVKKESADDLKDLKAAAKDIQKMLPAQRERIDNLFLEQKSWPFETWRERYLDHPLVGTLARRIIWCFTTGRRKTSAVYFDGKLVGANDEALKNLGAKATVALWHPIGQPVEEVIAWRMWLETHQVQQPFKQAHREVYLLTDAERNTLVYSNRYAAHIIKQHQFNALCAARGWRNQLRLMVDDEYPPATLTVPKWNLRAEFWVEGAGDEYGVDTNDAGTYLRLVTDQVRFYPIDAAQRTVHASGGGYHATYHAEDGQPVPLEDIPPLVLSEVMRDVDLFVGVASVGNDPTWSDGGPQGRYRDYWHDYSFGDLSATAQTRKEVLERLIPRLKIAERCSFSDKFLVVRGDVRTYKIHLGSGNILMEPNDQYLCIVPARGTAKKGSGKVFLPFEGDQVLSIILSKAFLLAEDKKIKDATITSQIKRG